MSPIRSWESVVRKSQLIVVSCPIEVEVEPGQAVTSSGEVVSLSI